MTDGPADPREDARLTPQERFAEALREHVAEQAGGAYMTDYVVIAAAAMPDDPDSTTYVTASSDGPPHHRIGLVHYLALRTDGIVER